MTNNPQHTLRRHDSLYHFFLQTSVDGKELARIVAIYLRTIIDLANKGKGDPRKFVTSAIIDNRYRKITNL